MERYCEQVIGGIYNRGNITAINIPNTEIDCYGYDIEDSYHSVFMYGEDMVSHVKEVGGIRGFKGPVYADAFVWDFDSINIQESLDDTISLIERLLGEGIEEGAIKVFFSGSKGMHVYLTSLDLINLGLNAKIPQISKYICLNFADGLKTVDSSIYDRTRIIRVTNSRHPKTGLYKIPLTIEEVTTLTIEEIQTLAAEQRQIEIRTSITATCDYLTYSIKSAMSNTELDKSRKTTRVNMIDGIYNGFDDGNRNVGLSSLAGVLHARNMSPEFIHGIVTAVNNQGSTPLKESAINTIIESVSRYEVDEDFKEADGDEIMTMSQAADKWETLKKNRQYLNSGFVGLDAHLTNFDPGKVFMIAARGGVGKTLLGMQICNEIARSQGGFALFISLEMAASAIYYRAAQIEYNKDGNFADSKDFTETLLDDGAIRSTTLHNWQHLLMVDRDSLTTSLIEQYHQKANDKYNGKVKDILIDYVGLIGDTDDYHGLSKVARELKAIAKRLNVRITLLVQLSRKAGDGTTEPGLHMLRDSGSLEEAADMVMGMWLSSGDTSRIHNKFLKNRDGERGGKFDLIQSGLTYECVPFDDSEDTKSVEGW